MEYDILIVGAGISGATLAERYATQLNKKVLLIDRREEIGGNCHDYYNEENILVPKYGPHFFHTNSEKVWSYLSKFTDWLDYEHRVLSRIDNETLVPVPININTVNIVFNEKIKNSTQMMLWLKENCEKIDNPRNSEESALSKMGSILYEKLFKNYTIKQWDMCPTKLHSSILERIPVYTDFEDRYFKDQYQAMPKDGYSKLFSNMLNNPNITVKLNTDFELFRNKLSDFEKVFFTGRIDTFFSNKIDEKLRYRSLIFKHEIYDKEYFQERTMINYPNHEEFTRIAEPKHATGQKHPKTTIIKEYPTWNGDPHYPVLCDETHSVYEKYREKAKKLEQKGIYFIGRLAEYKYYNMDQAFLNALHKFEELEMQSKKSP